MLQSGLATNMNRNGWVTYIRYVSQFLLSVSEWALLAQTALALHFKMSAHLCFVLLMVYFIIEGLILLLKIVIAPAVSLIRVLLLHHHGAGIHWEKLWRVHKAAIKLVHHSHWIGVVHHHWIVVIWRHHHLAWVHVRWSWHLLLRRILQGWRHLHNLRMLILLLL